MQHKHTPTTDPCERCGLPATQHIAQHEHTGECCILPARLHRPRQNQKQYDKHRIAFRDLPYLGIDGEGRDIDGYHTYTLLAASSRDGTFRSHVTNPKGLRAHQCFDFLLSLPPSSCFGFSLGYDRTMMLADLPDPVIYRLLRPELRQKPLPSGHTVHMPVYYSPGGQRKGAKVYILNLDGSKLTIRRGFWQRSEVYEWRVKEESRKVALWDIFKFYQCSFVKALKSWSVGDKDTVARMQRMKEKRSEFAKESEEDVLAYCYDECAYMAELAYQLTQAHEAVGLNLKRYDGPGSTAAVLLNRFGAADKKRDPPDEMRTPLACGFFGGRFENSVLGAVDGPLWAYDISSAYPYQQTFLPCLEHGTWEHTDDRKAIDNARAALVRYGFGDPPKNVYDSWAPFPFRTKEGSIAFPLVSGGGWVWQDEYREGERLFSHVHFREAWVLRSDCDCRPFAGLPNLYRERNRIGKEGRGIVLKLAMNSCYGKLAQSVGRAPFNSWIWAGLITSGTRAQILSLLGLHKNRRNLLSAATDGIYSRERLSCPLPRDTGTWELESPEGRVKKPLGGWEEKLCEGATFFARPGIYFPVALRPEDVDKVRARGVGRRELYEHHERLIQAWRDGKMSYSIPGIRRFMGAKNAILRSGEPGKRVYTRSVNYGQWIEWPVEMGFSPLPKRESVNEDGTLALRSFPNEESTPYRKSMLSPEARAALSEMAWLLEQPDGHEYDWDPSWTPEG